MEDFMHHQYIPGAPEIVNWMIPSVILSLLFTLVFIAPALYFLARSVSKSVADAKENWTNVKTVTTAGYHYQVHNKTGKRRVFSIHPLGDTSVNKDWIKGLTDVP